MYRAERRRIARYIKKDINKMSLSEIENLINSIAYKGIEEGTQKALKASKESYIDGVETGISLSNEALKELYGFGDKRIKRIEEYINNSLEKEL